jgi:YfiH family protein
MVPEVRIVTSGLFFSHPGVVFGMSTRVGGVSPEPFGMNTSFRVGDDPECVRENRRRFLSVLGAEESALAIPGQVHGDSVFVVTEPGRYEACDALITDREGLFVSISVADCLPIFLFDHKRRLAGAVHSGWRGTRLGILSKALRLFQEHSSRAADVLAFIGPGAGPCCYEVGEEVAAQFEPSFVVRARGGRARLDLPSANRAMLGSAGIPSGNIEVSTSCTICNPEFLHSYRRDGAKSGRMMGVIGLR